MMDMTCLAEGLVVPTDFEVTGLNSNEIVIGTTGCGKSFSNAYSRLVHTYNSSVVVPLSKKAIKEKFSKMFEKRGYEVLDLNLAHPEACQVGYDPLDYVKTDEDVIQLARNLVVAGHQESQKANVDPYWDDSATSMIAAEIALIRLNANNANAKPCFADVVKLHRSIKYDISSNLLKTNIDVLFEKAAHRYPENQASELWKTFTNLAARTASCIFSVANSAFDKTFSESVLELTRKSKKVCFEDLGKRRTALFITTSPMNKTLQNLVNLIYADMFRVLFEEAERSDDARLSIPVHMVCDDFACGSRINDFEEYISIFRAAGISVTLLLQSESQLEDMYGETAATTIINNCDTYVYMGGMDISTCEHVAKRINKPLHWVLAMPLARVAVFRKGSKPYIAQRYQILEDPLYKEVMNDNETSYEDRVS